MKLLLLGGNGQVGRELRRSLPALGEVVVATRDGGDADAVADFDAPGSVAELVQARNIIPGTVEQAMNLILIARNLERVGDHATNIAEDVVFVVSGEDIRHGGVGRR